MTNKQYSFQSVWNIDASPTVVWQALIATPFSWSDWWPELIDVHNMNVTPTLEGTSFSCAWQAPIGYRLRSDVRIGKIVPRKRVILRTSGDIVGQVVCVMHEQAGTTRLKINWQVETTKPWMNRLTFLLKPAFVWSHHAVMRSGERGLRRYVKKARR